MITSNVHVRYAVLTVILVTVVWPTGCSRSDNRAKGVGLLATPAPDQIKASDYQPEKPFVQTAPGLSLRTVFVVEPTGKNPYHIAVQDILVAPSQQGIQVPLQGAGVFEVRGGSGTATIGDKAQELKLGSTFSVPEGTPLKLASNAEALTLRVYVVQAP